MNTLIKNICLLIRERPVECQTKSGMSLLLDSNYYQSLSRRPEVRLSPAEVRLSPAEAKKPLHVYTAEYTRGV